MLTPSCKAKAGIGTWRPASLTSRDVIAIKAALAFIAAVRCVDYLTFGPAARAAGVERLITPGVWALLCGAIASFLAVGMATRWHTVVWLGHSIGCCVYLALAVAQLQISLLFNPPDDYRKVGPLLIIALLHGLFASRSGPRPITPDAEVTVERSVAGSE